MIDKARPQGLKPHHERCGCGVAIGSSAIVAGARGDAVNDTQTTPMSKTVDNTFGLA
jgi:hypothetical protein